MNRASDAESVKRRIVDWGSQVGLASIGVAPAVHPARGDFLIEWLSRGCHGPMDYLARDPALRYEPSAILEGCRSVICASIDYGGGLDPAESNSELGRVSRYAWGDDYHLVLKEKLDAVAFKIREARPGVKTRVAIDTSPVLEKPFAAEAGLGWIGKNTNLINSDRGSYFFLGEIFTSLSLPRDEPAVDRCGSCVRCIETCPTGALIEPYVLDARRCLSYWTIEHRGAIDRSLHEPLGNWIFGCDICQTVCPWNRKAPAHTEPRFDLREDVVGRSLEEWSGLTVERYRERARNSAIKRARYEGLMRNVSIAIKNARRGRSY